MGTSKGYLPPKGFLWRDAKRAVTDMSKNNFGSDSIGNAMAKYANARSHSHGWASNNSSGSSSSNRQTSVGKSGAKALNFINSVKTQGFRQTLETIGLRHLIGRNSKDIYLALVDYFVEERITIEDNIIRDCFTELLKDLNIFDEIEDFKKIDGNDFLQKFIIKYIQKSFINDFHEKIQGLCKNIKETNRAIGEIKRFIRSEIEHNYSIEELSKINFNSNEGINFINKKCNEAFEIFKVFGGA